MFKSPRVCNKYELRDKVEAVRRVLDGEPKAAVRTSLGVPESTLRGWLNTKDIAEAARKQSKQTIATVARLFCLDADDDGVAAAPTLRLDVSSLKANRSYKNYAGSEGTVTDSSDPPSPQSCDEQRFRWTQSSDNNDDEEQQQSSTSSSIGSTKTKRTDDDEDPPSAKRRCCEEPAASEYDREVVDLESRHWKELLLELYIQKRAELEDFVYLWVLLDTLDDST